MVYLLRNPKANRGALPVTAAQLAPLFSGKEIVEKNVLEMGSYAAFLDTLTEEDEVVLSGGDGTLNQFANGILGRELRNRVYMYKSGTGNDFLHDVYGKNPADGALLPLNRYLENLPVTTVKGKDYVFFNNTSFGVDGLVCAMTQRQVERGKKTVNYTSTAVKALLSYRCPNATVTVDGVTKTYKKVWLASALNGRYFGGGMMIAPDQDRLSDEMTFVLLHSRSTLSTLCLFPSIFTGEHVGRRHVVVLTGKEITVTFDRPQALQMDGEVIGEVTSYTTVKRSVNAANEEKEEQYAL